MSEEDERPGWGAWLDKAGRVTKKTAEQIRKSEAWDTAKEAVEKTAKTVRDSEAWSNAKNLAGQAADEVKHSEAWASAKQAGDRAKDKLRETAEQVGRAAREATATGALVIKTLKDAPDDLHDRVKLIGKLVACMSRLADQYDAEANAFSIGYFAQAGAGVAGVNGLELRYVRGSDELGPLLRVSRLSGRSARLAFGAATSAYAGCFYGQAPDLRRPLVRKGGDVGLVFASLAFFRALVSDEARASGWMFALNVGLEIGIPFLSDLTAFEIEEEPLAAIELSASEVELIEAALVDATDRKRRRSLARMLVR